MDDYNKYIVSLDGTDIFKYNLKNSDFIDVAAPIRVTQHMIVDECGTNIENEDFISIDPESMQASISPKKYQIILMNPKHVSDMKYVSYLAGYVKTTRCFKGFVNIQAFEINEFTKEKLIKDIMWVVINPFDIDTQVMINNEKLRLPFCEINEIIISHENVICYRAFDNNFIFKTANSDIECEIGKEYIFDDSNEPNPNWIHAHGSLIGCYHTNKPDAKICAVLLKAPVHIFGDNCASRAMTILAEFDKKIVLDGTVTDFTGITYRFDKGILHSPKICKNTCIQPCNCITLPAIENKFNGEKMWFVNGKIGRIDRDNNNKHLPSMTTICGSEYYHQNGVLHNDDVDENGKLLPAVKNKHISYKGYYINGKKLETN